MNDSPHFNYDDDPAEPGWKRWQFRDPTRFNAFIEPIHIRVDALDGGPPKDGDRGAIARVRMLPRREHSNMRDAVHGGALLGFIDVALFAGSRGLGVLGAGGAVTLDLSTQFIGAGSWGRPLEARVELLRETGRLLFLRGLVAQDDQPVIASFTGTLRKMGENGGA